MANPRHSCINHNTLAKEDHKVFTQSIRYLFRRPSASPTPASPPNPAHVMDEQGEECAVISSISTDDIFAGMDVELGVGSEVVSRLNYPITEERLNVGGGWGRES